MAVTHLPIYILRSQCKRHKLDTMRSFVLRDTRELENAFFQLELDTKKQWQEKNKCTHVIKFTHITDPEMKYSVKTKKAVKIWPNTALR